MTMLLTVKLTQDAHLDGTDESPCFRASGYLATEDEDDETGPTVSVRWYGSDEDAIDWSTPDRIEHYRLGDITAVAKISEE